MKRWLLLLLAFVVVLIACVYVFIPDTLKLSKTISLPVNRPGITRVIFDIREWGQWWPANPTAPGADSSISYTYHNNVYRIDEQQRVSMNIFINGENLKAKTSFTPIPLSGDSLKLAWEGLMITSYNPITRLQAYFKSKELSADMDSILFAMQNHFSKSEKVYGIFIRREFVTDSFLVSTIAKSHGYPSTAFVYSLVEKLKQYAVSQGAESVGYPMMHSSTKDSIEFETQVAVPINKKVTNSSSIVNKKMITGAKVITTEVTGATAQVADAFRRVELFISDYQFTSPAIPFISLVTDRRTQPDSSRWVSKIFYPVM